MGIGSSSAPERLLAESEWLVRLARSLVANPDDARDLAQDALTAALARPPDDHRPVRPWLARIARNLSISRALHRDARTLREQDAARAESTASTAEVVERVEMQRTVVDAVLALDEPYRSTILLRYWENLPPRDVATRMRVPVETVRTRTKRGLELLRERLDRRHGERGAWLSALIPLVRASQVTNSTAATGAAVSIIAMSLSTKIALSVLAVLGLAWIGYEIREPPPDDMGLVRAPAVADSGEELPALDPALAADEAERRVPVTKLADASTPATSNANGLELFVASSSGAGIPQAQVVIFREETVVAKGITDPQGFVKFPSDKDTAEVAVLASGWPLVRATIGLEAGRRTVTLLEGALLGGRVRIDGAVPRESLQISFRPNSLFGPGANVPKCVRELLGLRLEAPSRGSGPLERKLVAVTDSTGEFLFRGLPPELPGTLEWDGPYVLEATEERLQEWERDSLSTNVLRRDVELRLTLGVQLRLRVVDSTGIPVSDAGVSVMSRRDRASGGNSTSMDYGLTDHQGLFRRTLGPTPPMNVHVRIMQGEGLGASGHELVCPPDLRGVWDVGDLALDEIRTIRVHVQDREGSPIRGARAGSSPSQESSTARSDGTGDLETPFRREDQEVVVQAVGYEPERVAVPAGETHVVATLSKICLLTFDLKDGTGVDRRTLELTLRGGPPMFIDETPGSPRLLQGFTGSYSRDTNDDGTIRFTIDHDEDGRWKVAGTRPGIPLKAELVTGAGLVVARADVAPLSPGEHRAIVLALDRPPVVMRVRVQGPDGQPVPAAKVVHQHSHIGADESAGGVYTLPPILAEEFTLTVHAAGFPTKRMFFVPTSSDELTVTLERPLSLEVELVTPEGSPAQGTFEVQAGVDLRSLKNGKLQPSGRWLVPALPSGEVLIQVKVEGRTLSLAHDMSESVRRIVVEKHGMLTARAELPEDQIARPWSIAIYRVDSSLLEARAPTNHATTGLRWGSYEVWLETREVVAPWRWTKVGSPSRIVLDEQNPTAELTLRP